MHSVWVRYAARAAQREVVLLRDVEGFSSAEYASCWVYANRDSVSACITVAHGCAA